MLDVVGIGSTFVDHFFQTDEFFLKKFNLKPEDDFLFSQKKIIPKTIFEKLQVITRSPGGIAINTLGVLSKLKMKVGYCGVIGKDTCGDFWAENIGRIDITHVKRKGRMSICACLLTDEGKKRTFLSKVNPNDNDFLNDLDIAYLNSAKFIHLGPLILNSKNGINITSNLVKEITKPKISFSPSILYIAEGPRNLDKIISNTYILFLNQKEMKYLTGQNPELGSKSLIKTGPSIVVCTLAENGSLITTQKHQFHSPRVDVANIIDSTGAGDAFAAGFLYGLLNNKPLKWSSNFANKIAAQSLTNFGLSWLAKL